VKPVSVCIPVLVLLVGGCAAPVGQTNLSLHQRAQFPDGTRYVLSEFKMSEKDGGPAVGAKKVPGPDVTVWVDIANAGKPITAADVIMHFFYTGDRNLEIEPPEVASSTNSVPRGGQARVSKTFRVEDVPELFRSRRLRVVIGVPDYPTVTFSGSNP
jgi:hypothetical protein